MISGSNSTRRAVSADSEISAQAPELAGLTINALSRRKRQTNPERLCTSSVKKILLSSRAEALHINPHLKQKRGTRSKNTPLNDSQGVGSTTKFGARGYTFPDQTTD